MSLTLFNIKKWYKKLAGQSELHINQGLGKCFAINEVKGYYNNMIGKVTMQPELLACEDLPLLKTDKGKKIYYPVAIFQYGLGAYDLYLIKGDDVYRRKFEQCLEWTVANQEKTGAWSNFFFIYPKHPYGAMAQGEGISLLVRGYVLTGQTHYLQCAKRALDFMLTSVEEGGTSLYKDGQLTFLAYTHQSAVMNGWVFGLFGLYDYVVALGDKGRYAELMELSLNTLERMLPKFDRGFWSMYDLDNHIAIPFYHRLHIAQMQALYKITGKLSFKLYAYKWQANNYHFINRTRAFLIKAWLKIREQ